MKPPPFRYVRARGLDDALGALADYGDEAKILAGGQSLVPMMSFRLARPAVLVDVNFVPGLDGVVVDGNGLSLGALTRTRRLEDVEGLPAEWAVVPPLARLIGHPPIRVRGTVGGSIAHADPAAELPLLVTAFDAELEVASSSRTRVIGSHEFFLGPFQTSMDAEEMLTEIRVAAPPAGARAAIVEHAQRAGDFALVAVLAAVHVVDGVVRWARIGLGGTAPVPQRAEDAEKLLIGQRPGTEVFRAAGAEAAHAVVAGTDVHASKEYRMLLTAALVERALNTSARESAQVEEEEHQ